MEKINDGGPAFPIGSTPEEWGNGMTLRDYFAAKAMPVAYSDYCIEAREKGWQPDWKTGVALHAYAMADAMLKAREVQS